MAMKRATEGLGAIISIILGGCAGAGGNGTVVGQELNDAQAARGSWSSSRILRRCQGLERCADDERMLRRRTKRFPMMLNCRVKG